MPRGSSARQYPRISSARFQCHWRPWPALSHRELHRNNGDPGVLTHKAFAGVQQSTVTGKPDAAVRPQTTWIKITGGSERIVLTTMRVARQICQLGQFPEYGHSGRGSKSLGQLFERANCPLLQEALQILGVKHGSSHNGTHHHIRRYDE